MFDPERDDVRTSWPFAARLGVVALVTLLTAAAIWPSISGFGTPSDATAKVCVAVLDGWHTARPDPGPNAPLEEQQAYTDWHDTEGQCITEGRHRLFLSAFALILVLSGTLAGMVMVRRRRTRANLRHSGTPGVLL